ncbi:MAG: Mrp/NBP35 family ATP-binding protein [Alphaproteobacteria bacterium]|nr:Mrp/NBP35 family ATP-binding protein [Alphaproteobacteria bacterium]
MTSSLTEDMILDALKNVSVEGSVIDLVATGHVSGVVIKDGNIGFSLEVDPEDAEAIQPLRIAAEQAVMKIPGVLSATAMLTAHKKPEPQQQPQAGGASSQGVMHQPARHIIAVASGKGGVGKSTTAINLALAIKAMGMKVGVLDADIYGPSLPRLTGVNQKPEAENNKLIPLEAFGMKVMSIGFLMDEAAPTIWRGPMVMSALEQMLKDVAWGDLDVLVIDMPPGTGDAQLTLSQRAKLSGAVIVSTPQDLALIDARKGLNMFLKVGVPVLGIVENMSYFVCPSCGDTSHIFGHGGAETEAQRLSVPFLGKIPLEMDIRAHSDAGTPIVASQPDSPHAKAYQDIAKIVMERLPQEERAAPSITIN